MKVGIIGAGAVGSSTAFALIMKNVARKVVLIDANEKKAAAEALDMAHATPFANANKVKSGTYQDLNDADVVIVTAGATMLKGETRIDLLEKNVKIFKNIIPQIKENAPNCIILVATNPVDIMTAVALKLCGFDKNKVIGSGTVLDSARFKTALGKYFGISSQSLHSYVLGEHGDSEVLAWSCATGANLDLSSLGQQLNKEITSEIKADIEKHVKYSAYGILEDKGNTCYGIAGALTRICQAIKDNEYAVLTVSTVHDEVEGVEDICLSLPSVVGKRGIHQVVVPRLNDCEHKDLQSSAEKLKEYSVKALSLVD
ncbi:MAG: L-lactate dehydrogenase [Alphaproteobacteria bacterium]